MDPIKPSPRTRKVDRAAVAEVFILHLPCSHDIIDIEKEATVDGCPLVSQEMTAQFVRRGRSFFCADIFAEGIAQGKAGKCKSEDADDDVIGRSFVHAIPSFQLRYAAERQSLWRAYKIPPYIKTQFDAEGNRLPLVAIGSRNAPDIFIIAYL